nr:MAG TPA: hypothetical protein [Caudoviricetes sp.]
MPHKMYGTEPKRTHCRPGRGCGILLPDPNERK